VFGAAAALVSRVLWLAGAGPLKVWCSVLRVAARLPGAPRTRLIGAASRVSGRLVAFNEAFRGRIDPAVRRAARTRRRAARLAFEARRLAPPDAEVLVFPADGRRLGDAVVE
jgi:hypothetical protein